MPYVIRKARNKDLYWVVNTETGKKYEKMPTTLVKAQAQIKFLRAIEHGYVLKYYFKLLKFILLLFVQVHRPPFLP